MNKLKNFARNFWKDESGQGMVEYVLLVVVIVGILFIFKDKIRGIVSTKMDSVGSEIQNFSKE